MYQAILFDMDGTVVDTERVWHLAAEGVLQRRGIHLTHEQHNILQQEVGGKSLQDTCFFLKTWMQLSDDVYQLVHENVELAQQYYHKGLTFIDGFPDFHRAVSRYVSTALATNADRSGVRLTDRMLHLSAFFGEHMYCIDDVNHVSKPQPDVYQYAAACLGVLPEHAIVIEDSQPGVQAAKAAGAYCIGINTNGTRQALQQADEIVDHYDHIAWHKLIHCT